MGQRVVIIQGHPDPEGGHLCHALAEAYAKAAAEAGRGVRRIEVAALDFPVLRSQAAWLKGSVPPDIARAQEAILWADHVLILYPLWLGTMPALLKAFLEQVCRPGFAFGEGERGLHAKRLAGRSARVVVTMGMPALAYRLIFGAHSLKSLERNILGFVGMAPVRDTLFGMVEGGPPEKRTRWLAQMAALGGRGA